MQWRSWLRHCAPSRQVAVSIPDGIIGIFHWHNPTSRTMALGSTHPLTEMITSNLLGVMWPVPKAKNLTTFTCRLSWNLVTSTSWNPIGLSRPVMELLYLLRKSSLIGWVGIISKLCRDTSHQWLFAEISWNWWDNQGGLLDGRNWVLYRVLHHVLVFSITKFVRRNPFHATNPQNISCQRWNAN